MRVQFVQSGGLLGIVKGCELDTVELAPDAARELERLVGESGISASGELLSDIGRDLQQYEINIEDGSRKLSLVLNDTTIPPSVKPLVGFLKKHGGPGRSID